LDINNSLPFVFHFVSGVDAVGTTPAMLVNWRQPLEPLGWNNPSRSQHTKRRASDATVGERAISGPTGSRQPGTEQNLQGRLGEANAG
jgi:hypothetical protein